MSDEVKRPREFWICENNETGERIVNQDDGPRYWKGIHVIEFAAFEELQGQLAGYLSRDTPTWHQEYLSMETACERADDRIVELQNQLDRMKSIDKTDHRYQPMKYQLIEVEKERDELKAKLHNKEFHEGVLILRAINERLRDQLAAAEFERTEYKRLAESWMSDHDKLKEKYEPLVATIGAKDE